MEYDTIFAILQRGEADAVMGAAKSAGAQGGTIFLARGTGSHEAKTFFGLTIESGREVLMIVSAAEDTGRILKAVVESAHLEEPGSGIAFVVKGVEVYGLSSRNPLK